MKKSTKWIFGVVGLIVCFYVGWLIPFAWLLWIVGVFVLLVVPNAPEPKSQIAPVEVLNTNTSQYVSHGVPAQLEELISKESDPKVKEGLERALALVRANVPEAVPSLVDEFAPQPELTRAELDEQKQRQELRNINTILYTASFLLVGAAALFIGFNDLAGPTLKFGTILLAALAFYVSGLAIHKQSIRLQPAATAFVGTGLALIPFVGLALNSFVLNDASMAWWITSLVGLLMFCIAVQQIKSTVMAYLTLAFVFSLATSSASVLDTPFVWYFVSVIVTSSLLSYLGYKSPKLVPASFAKPLEVNSQVAAPVALIGSIFMAGSFTAFEYAMLSGVGALHYLVATLSYATTKTRFIYWSAARVLLILFAASLTYHFMQDWHSVGWVMLTSGVAAHLYSAARVKAEPREVAWLWGAIGLIAASVTGWLDEPALASLSFTVLAGVSAWQLRVMRKAEFAFAGVIAGVILPLTLLRGVVDPALGYDFIACVTIVLSALGLLFRWLAGPRQLYVKQALSITYGALLAESIVLVAMGDQPMTLGVVMILAGTIMYAASFVERAPTLVIGSNILLLVGVFAIYGQVFESYTWVPLATGLTLGALWYGLSWYHRRPEAVDADDVQRSFMLATSGVAVLGLAALIAMFQSDETTVAGALVGCLTAGVVAYEGFVRNKLIGYEVAAYVATFSLQRLVAYVYPDADWLLYTHWWAITGAAVAYMYYLRTGNRQQALNRGVVSLAMLSIPTGLAALGDSTGMYRSIFLFEHVALAVAGLSLNKKIAVRWGAIGIGLAVLYMLQGYTYLLLVLIALGLIILAVWRLTKKG